MKLAILVGTRPEAIKMAPVVLQASRHAQITVRLIATGQHREMLRQALADFGLSPDVDLDVMTPGQTLASLSASLFTAVDKMLEEERPDWVLVQGDTTTVMVAAMAAFYRQVPIGHVEAGLRSHNRLAPFPEEVNRRVASIVADLHFAPTVSARDNLLAEGVAPESIVVTGNTVIDALLYMRDKTRQDPPQLPADVKAGLERWRRMVLITGHRRENFGQGFESICFAIRELARAFPDVFFVYPVHLNPNVRDLVHSQLGNISNVCLTQPQTYKPFIHLLDRCDLVLTDSGGVQEEAPSLGKPVLVMREVTERPEGVQAGTARLVGTDPQAIIAQVTTLLTDASSYSAMSQAVSPYGTGNAAEHIIETLLRYPRKA